MKNNLAEKIVNMPSLDVVKKIADACEDAKAKDLSILNVEKIFSLADYFVVVSGRSDRQVQGITNRVIDSLREMGIEPVSIEGVDEAHWVLVDYGDVVLHVFYEDTRSYYDIETLWTTAEKVNLRKSRKSPALLSV